VFARAPIAAWLIRSIEQTIWSGASPASVAVLPPKSRIECVSDLIFGLALSIGALALIAQPWSRPPIC